MSNDLRHALRLFIKAPGFSAVVVAVLALGIGANTAIFSVVNGVLLKPLPFADPSRLVAIETMIRNEPDQSSYLDLADFRVQSRSLDRIGAYATVPVTVAGEAEAASLSAAVVSGETFALLGVPPVVGRAIESSDDQAGAARVAVISESLWDSRFSRDRSILGRAMTLDGQPFTVIGVMPSSFEFPMDQDRIQLWLPVKAFPFTAQFAAQRGASFLNAIGHLRAGVTIEAAQSELSAIAARLAAEYPSSNQKRSVLIKRWQDVLVRDYRLGLLVLLSAVAAVLLIACANIANLLLARGTGRRKEMAIRAALGASRARLARQLLIESLVLGIAGGVVGLILAQWCLDALVGMSPLAIPRLHAVRMDRGVLIFTTLASILTGLLFGLAPAIQVSRSNPGETLKDGDRGSSGASAARTRQILVVAEVALSLMLLAGAGLLVRSLLTLQQVNPGFNPDRALAMQLMLSDARYPDAATRINFYRRLREAIETLPGATSSAITTTLPLSGSNIDLGFQIEGRPADPSVRTGAGFFAISPDYFAMMGIPLLKGRTFSNRDDETAPKVVVINETLAKRYWPDEDPIGKRLTIGYNNAGPAEVVGIVGDVKQTNLADQRQPQMYAPFPQTPWPVLTAIARTSGSTETVAASFRSALARLDPNQGAAEIRTLDQYLARSIATPRFNALLVASFASLAVLLAGFGLYGVMAYSVAQRRREIGIRMALGARPSDVRSLVVSQALKMGLAGLGIGLVGALAVARVIGGLLFGVGANDPATFVAVSALLVGVVLVAAYLPARRATRVDPMVALRAE